MKIQGTWSISLAYWNVRIWFGNNCRTSIFGEGVSVSAICVGKTQNQCEKTCYCVPWRCCLPSIMHDRVVVIWAVEIVCLLFPEVVNVG